MENDIQKIVYKLSSDNKIIKYGGTKNRSYSVVQKKTNKKENKKEK